MTECETLACIFNSEDEKLINETLTNYFYQGRLYTIIPLLKSLKSFEKIREKIMEAAASLGDIRTLKENIGIEINMQNLINEAAIGKKIKALDFLCSILQDKNQISETIKILKELDDYDDIICYLEDFLPITIEKSIKIVEKFIGKDPVTIVISYIFDLLDLKNEYFLRIARLTIDEMKPSKDGKEPSIKQNYSCPFIFKEALEKYSDDELSRLRYYFDQESLYLLTKFYDERLGSELLTKHLRLNNGPLSFVKTFLYKPDIIANISAIAIMNRDMPTFGKLRNITIEINRGITDYENQLANLVGFDLFKEFEEIVESKEFQVRLNERQFYNMFWKLAKKLYDEYLKGMLTLLPFLKTVRKYIDDAILKYLIDGIVKE